MKEHRRHPLAQGVLPALLAAAMIAGCASKDPDAALKAAAERAKAAIKSIDHAAFQQKVEPAEVKQVQQQLTAIQEYMGPIDGQLNAVTLNAVEAFQRSEELSPDGMLTQETLSRLSEAAAAATAKSKAKAS